MTMQPTTHINRADLIEQLKARRTDLYGRMADIKGTIDGIEQAIDVIQRQPGIIVPETVKR